MAVATILDLLGEFFVVQACKSYSRLQNFSFWGFYHKNLAGHRSDPKKAHPCVISRLLSCRAQKSIHWSDLYANLRKKV